jgi:hypothetical protein
MQVRGQEGMSSAEASLVLQRVPTDSPPATGWYARCVSVCLYISIRQSTYLRAHLGQLCALQVPARKPRQAGERQCAAKFLLTSSVALT